MKRLNFLIILLLAFILTECSENEQEDYSELTPLEQELKRGKRVYKQYCRSCHGADGKMGMSGAKDLSQSELSLAQRKLMIANGKGTMTPFKNILSPEEISAVAKYTMTLSQTDEK